jgi:prepilin-type processing-associated H-X9-DG protein
MEPPISGTGENRPQPLDYANPLHRAKKRRPRWLLIIFLSLIVVGLFWITFIPSLSSHDSVPRVRSASNLRQIGQAILLYTNDHQGQYPDSFATILLNEDVTSEVFVSPSRNETPAIGPTTQAIANQLSATGHVSYIYLGRGLSTNTVTPNTIVAYEKILNSSSATNMLFGDGHVEFVDPPTTAKILARALAGNFPRHHALKLIPHPQWSLAISRPRKASTLPSRRNSRTLTGQPDAPEATARSRIRVSAPPTARKPQRKKSPPSLSSENLACSPAEISLFPSQKN